jgi:hypothetical protein
MRTVALAKKSDRCNAQRSFPLRCKSGGGAFYPALTLQIDSHRKYHFGKKDAAVFIAGADLFL